MNPKTAALQERTHEFFVQVMALCDNLPKSSAGQIISEQLLRSAGGTDSNYRAACKARSKKEFIAKIGVAAEEADESLGWLTALRDGGLADGSALTTLIIEADALTAIFVKSGQTAKKRLAEANKRRAEERRRTRRQAAST